MLIELFIILLLINLCGLICIIIYQRNFILLILYFEFISLLCSIGFLILGHILQELTTSYVLLLLTLSTAETVLGLIICICAFQTSAQINILTYKKLKY
jgi:NADH:ubiquinone oxidoreductase subunit K